MEDLEKALAEQGQVSSSGLLVALVSYICPRGSRERHGPQWLLSFLFKEDGGGEHIPI